MWPLICINGICRAMRHRCSTIIAELSCTNSAHLHQYLQDLFTEEEQQKREQRAARFGLPAGSGLEWKPPQVMGGSEGLVRGSNWLGSSLCVAHASGRLPELPPDMLPCGLQRR